MVLAFMVVGYLASLALAYKGLENLFLVFIDVTFMGKLIVKVVNENALFSYAIVLC